MKNIKAKIIKLSNFINYHNYRYYILNNPIITNYKYDKIFKYLIKLEKKHNFYYKHSPTKRLTYNLLLNKEKVKHKYKMYSINNVYNKKKLILWIENLNKKFSNIGNKDYFCELKYDGLAISLIYKFGYLSKASTRGDGEYGNNILNTINYIKEIPLFIKKFKKIKFLDIKGEIVYSKKNFIKLNKIRLKENLKKFSNPRNAASGIVHNISNYNTIYKRKLSFVPYFICTDNKTFNNLISSQSLCIKILNKYFFKYQAKSYKLCKNNREILDFISYWEKNIDKSIYPIDGIVVKINKLDLQNKLKSNNIFHKWCIAYKFKDKEYITTLNKIIFKVGKSGIIVPIIEFTPIKISGTIVKRANLYNSNIYSKFNLSIGDKIIIKKCGNIIPKLVKNINYIDSNKKYYFPKHCPSCKKILVKKNNIYYCLNKDNCYKQKVSLFKHFITKNAMDIKINKNLLKKIIKKKIVQSLSDFYILSKDSFKNLDVTDKESKKIIDSIYKSKNKKLYNILYSLSIPNIGLNISKKISSKYNNISELLSDISKNKTKINLGQKKTSAIKKYFNKKNLILIKKFKQLGLKI